MIKNMCPHQNQPYPSTYKLTQKKCKPEFEKNSTYRLPPIDQEKLMIKFFPIELVSQSEIFILPDFDVHNKTNHKPFLKTFKLEYQPAQKIF